MQYGIRICSEFGGYMPVGYVPDSFGQSSSMYYQPYNKVNHNSLSFLFALMNKIIRHKSLKS